MNDMERRVKKLEEKADKKSGKHIEFIWTESDEDVEQAKEKWRREHPGEEQDVILYCVCWKDESP